MEIIIKKDINCKMQGVKYKMQNKSSNCNCKCEYNIFFNLPSSFFFLNLCLFSSAWQSLKCIWEYCLVGSNVILPHLRLF